MIPSFRWILTYRDLKYRNCSMNNRPFASGENACGQYMTVHHPREVGCDGLKVHNIPRQWGSGSSLTQLILHSMWFCKAYLGAGKATNPFHIPKEEPHNAWTGRDRGWKFLQDQSIWKDFQLHKTLQSTFEEATAFGDSKFAETQTSGTKYRGSQVLACYEYERDHFSPVNYARANSAFTPQRKRFNCRNWYTSLDKHYNHT